jgi:hypothetical protein
MNTIVIPSKIDDLSVAKFVKHLIVSKDQSFLTSESYYVLRNLYSKLQQEKPIVLSILEQNALDYLKKCPEIYIESEYDKLKHKCENIIRKFVYKAGYDFNSLRTPSHKRELAEIRQMSWLYCYENIDRGKLQDNEFFVLIGSIFKRNRNTVRHGIKLIKEDKNLYKVYLNYIEKLKQIKEKPVNIRFCSDIQKNIEPNKTIKFSFLDYLKIIFSFKKI